MWKYATISLVIAVLCGVQGCGNTVSPGQRASDGIRLPKD